MTRWRLEPLLAFLLLTTAAVSVAQDQPLLVGSVIKVTDGDTIKVQLSSGPITVRLDSIDTPESNQLWGPEAKAALARLVDGRKVALEVITQDRYERLVAAVYVGDLNVNEQLVKDGHAWAYRRYLKDRNYCVWEHAARTLKRGLWSQPTGDWIYPSEWRRWRRDRTAAVHDFSRETVATCMAAIGKSG